MAKQTRHRVRDGRAAVERGELLAAIQQHMRSLSVVADAIGRGDPLAAAEALKRAVAGLEDAVRRIADRSGYHTPAAVSDATDGVTVGAPGRRSPRGPR